MRNAGCIVVVPVHRAPTGPEAAALRHNAEMLKAYPFVLAGPAGATALLAELADDLAAKTGASVSHETFAPAFFKSRAGYSRLLMDPAFYRSFEQAEWLLICQTDGLVLDAELGPWLDSDFSILGAPIFRGYNRPDRPPRFADGVNGGLSLRRIGDALRALDRVAVLHRGAVTRALRRSGGLAVVNAALRRLGGRQRVVLRPDVHEDIFWSVVVPRIDPDFRVPPPDIAARFAFEACPDYLYELNGQALPFGCHAFGRYAPGFWRAHLPRAVAGAVLPES